MGNPIPQEGGAVSTEQAKTGSEDMSRRTFQTEPELMHQWFNRSEIRTKGWTKYKYHL
jgi:hypothetical protein